uniref:Dymeclin n=1 Tax=Aceria tosichella TaxID=561515 RepID=A0A6G1S3Z5_9ACAR
MAKIDLKDNEFFEKFIGSEPVSSYDTQFWYQLLSCSFNFSRISSQPNQEKFVYETLRPFIDLLALNNSQSLNIGALTRVAIDRISRIRSQTGGQQSGINPFYGFQSFNSIFLLRIICKNIIENSSEDMLIQSFRARQDVPPQAAKVSNPPNAPPHLQAHPSIVQSAAIQQQSQTNSQQPSQQPQQPQTQPNPQAQPQQQSQQPSNQTATPSPEQTNANPNEIETQVNPLDNPNVQTTQEKDPKSQAQSKANEFTPGSSMLDQYISVLISLIVDMPLNDSTYLLQVEAINSLIVLLSVQMYSNNQAGQSYIYRTLMYKKCSIHALVLTKTLLNNFIRQDPLPQESGSLILGAAWVIEKTLWRVLTLGFGGPLEDQNPDEGLPLLARQSLLLLNVLTNHYTTGKNPYREAIVSCQDSRFSLSDPNHAFDNANNDVLATATTSKSIMASNSIKIEFNDLFDTICKNLHNNQVALLLYLLLHSNKIFKPFILTTCSRKLDQLVLPLLKILYTSIQRGSHAIYLIVILFVILSEEDSFSKSIHTIQLNGVPWFTDRTLNDISLGSFTTLIMIRSFQYNTFRVKDKFLHTNLFATLGNLSNHFMNLHPYVCVRIVDLLERLTKRYMTVVKPTMKVVDKNANRFSATLDVLNNDNPLARALATDTQKRDLQDVSSIELDSTSNHSSNNMSSNQNGNNAINISIPDQKSVIDTISNNNIVPAVENAIQELKSFNDSGQQSPGSSNSEHVIMMDDSKCDSTWLEEVIKMILEIINNTLAVRLNNNSDLVYTLLYKREVFNSLLSCHQSFYDQIVNIERILTFFYNKIEALQEQLSVDEIKGIILSAMKDWNFDMTRDPNSQLLFRYVEDEKPEDFFIPYMWEQIYYSSGIPWNAKRIVLFNPEMA